MAHRLKIDPTVLDDYMRVEHIQTKYELANRMGVAPSTVYRVLAGDMAPGEKFIIGLRTAFPGRSTDSLLVKE